MHHERGRNRVHIRARVEHARRERPLVGREPLGHASTVPEKLPLSPRPSANRAAANPLGVRASAWVIAAALQATVATA